MESLRRPLAAVGDQRQGISRGELLQLLVICHFDVRRHQEFVNHLADAQIVAVAQLGGGDLHVIHEGADNFSDQPKPLGGGGARIACGEVS